MRSHKTMNVCLLLHIQSAETFKSLVDFGLFNVLFNETLN